MAVFRIEQNKNYTHMSNYHFYDKTLSWKAKGILSNMLSLPESWDYSLAGLATLSSDGMTATRSAIKELEEHGYLIRKAIRKDGRICDWEYIIYECPKIMREQNQTLDEQDIENQVVENQQVENHTQLNTKELNTKELNTNISNTKDIGEKRKRFVPPTFTEVKEYCTERKNGVNPQRFIDYYTSNGWRVGKNKMKDWKAAVRTWERSDNGKPAPAPKQSGNVFLDLAHDEGIL